MIAPDTPDPEGCENPNGKLSKSRKQCNRDARLPEVIEDYLKGVPAGQIAKKHGITQYRVWDDIKHARLVWRKNNDIAIDELVHTQLAKLDLIEQKAWEQYERSCLFTSDLEQEYDSENAIVKKKLKKSQNIGDAQFLAIILKTVDQRCKLLKIGAYSNEQTAEITHTLIEVVVESPDQVAKMMNYKQYEKLTVSQAN